MLIGTDLLHLLLLGETSGDDEDISLRLDLLPERILANDRQLHGVELLDTEEVCECAVSIEGKHGTYRLVYLESLVLLRVVRHLKNLSEVSLGVVGTLRGLPGVFSCDGDDTTDTLGDTGLLDDDQILDLSRLGDVTVMMYHVSTELEDEDKGARGRTFLHRTRQTFPSTSRS